ncbi:DUF3558 domain-containing protein [Saccharothrix luteola]|uniref:DUF3558 domain-containing protein n=1 Tax=Saccharothrix luteola TaxID=2893018 RepID=UPI001E57DE7C|nr:DUF3558 domain-containing protein [Saccharothrix luteola]MCC8244986.1 DUF3558 domain-containing protein [Saccharothrix luteola]
MTDRMRTHILVAASLLAATSVTGCSAETQGTPTRVTEATGSPTSTSTDNGTTEHGAPRVKNPVDFSATEVDPCSALTATQVQTLGLAGTTGKDDSRASGKACMWSGFTGPSGLIVSLRFVAGSGGLDNLYNLRSSYKLFEPQSEIQGLPAALVAVLDNRARGECGLAVGLTDSQHILITVISRTGADPAPRIGEPCVVAREAADLMLTTIKGGS